MRRSAASRTVATCLEGWRLRPRAVAAARGWRWALLMGLWVWQSPVRAESMPVCLFFDGAGVAHVADHEVDSRFQCFGTTAEANRRRVPGKADDLASLRSSMKLSAPHMALLPALRRAAARHGLDVELLQALIAVESGFDAAARSPRGALGLMQIMPAYAVPYVEGEASEEAVSMALLDPVRHIEIGARMLADLSRRFGRVDAALAAWNAGPTPVRRHGGVPPISETRAHVHLVLELYWALLQDRQAQRATRFRVHARPGAAGPAPGPQASALPSPHSQRVALAPTFLPR